MMNSPMGMMMMAQMMNGGGTSNGEDGGPPNQMDMMMRLMMPEMFSDDTPPIFNLPVALGTRTIAGAQQSGVVEIRCVAPSMTSPKASLRLICGGSAITVRPDELKALEAHLTNIDEREVKAWFPGENEPESGTLNEMWLKAMALEDDMAQNRMLQQLAKTG